MDRFLPGQYCWHKFKIDDGAPISKICQVIDVKNVTDENQILLIDCGGALMECTNAEAWHIYGDK